MSDISLFEASVPTEGAVASAYEWLLDLKIGTPTPEYVNAADIDNLNPTFPPILRVRTGYATKNKSYDDKAGENCVLTFDAEKIRIPESGGVAQPWLRALIKASHAKGAGNRVEARFYDALDTTADGEAYEGIFRVEMVRKNTGYDASEWYTFTLTGYGEIDVVDSPVNATA